MNSRLVILVPFLETTSVVPVRTATNREIRQGEIPNSSRCTFLLSAALGFQLRRELACFRLHHACASMHDARDGAAVGPAAEPVGDGRDAAADLFGDLRIHPGPLAASRENLGEPRPVRSLLFGA